jgi:hypothetical protein
MRKLLVALALLVGGCTPTDPIVVAEPSEPVDAASSPPAEPLEPPSDPLLGFGYRGQPIHPLAVSAMVPLDWSVRGPLVVDLATQPRIDESVEIDGVRVSFDDDEPGYDVYLVHDRVGARFLLSVTQNGGGSGVFSTVVVVELHDDQLAPSFEAPAGDRCNGGLADAPRFDGDAVLVPRWLTPYDLVAFSTRDVSHIAPYVDLENSAMSCIGYALMRVEPGRDATLVSVTFAPGVTGQWHAGQPGWTESYPLQARFNRIYAQWVADGQTELDPAAIDRFVDELLAAE